MPSQNFSFIVVGGGIGGLASALALARIGCSVRVLEKAEIFGEIGAGLELGPNATRVLQKMGLLEQVLDYAVQPNRLVLKHALSGIELSALRVGGSAFRDRYQAPYVVMHRVDLLNILLDACRRESLVTLDANKEVVAVEPLDNGQHVTCADGSAYWAQAVVGADGLASRVRELIISDKIVTHGFACYRGTIPIEQVRAYAEVNDVVLWLGPGLHLVQYPVHRGEVYNQVAVFRSPLYQPDKDVMEWGTPNELEDAFRPTCPLVKKALSLIGRERKWIMSDREPISRWAVGTVVLMGDAAHPMLQYLAQGACQALEDAACLADKLRAQDFDVGRALTSYEMERMPRTAAVQRNARRFGDILHTGDDLTIQLRNRVLLGRSDEDCRDVDWLYAYGMEAPK